MGVREVEAVYRPRRFGLRYECVRCAARYHRPSQAVRCFGGHQAAHTEPIGGHCQPGVPCFPFGCNGSVSCNCRCHAVPECTCPTCLRRVEVARNDLQAGVEALHYAGPPGRFGRLFCVNCDQYWPCETIALLDSAGTDRGGRGRARS